MANVFAVLEIEKAVQVGDQTRLNGYKSFSAKNSPAIAIAQITPGTGASAVNIFDAKPENRYLDWIFTDWKFDIDSTNSAIDFSIGDSIFTANLTTGSYDEAALIAEIETQLDGAGLTGVGVEIDADKKIKISADVSFKLLPETGITRNSQLLKHIGFQYDTNDSDTQTGEPMEYGLRKLTLEVAGAGANPQNDVIKYLKVYSEFGDRLFCTDEDLRIHESDILRYVEAGRATFKNVIRKSQELIIEYFSAKGDVDIDGNPLTKWSFPITNNLRDWSVFMSLKLIMDDISKSPSDTYFQAARIYEGMEAVARQKFVATDYRKDGNALRDEYSYPNTISLFMK